MVKSTKTLATKVQPTGQIKKSHKQRVKGTSEADNPKYANKFYFVGLYVGFINTAAAKETKREDEKLAKKLAVEKLIEDKESKKQNKLSEKQKQLEEAKQRYLQAQSKKKNKKHKTKKTIMETEVSKKKVRFA
ncbi:unnamed protein product [Absidia cylindrospora]